MIKEGRERESLYIKKYPFFFFLLGELCIPWTQLIPRYFYFGIYFFEIRLQ